MGISFSCPLSGSHDLENAIESVIVKSVSFGEKESTTLLRSISFKGQDSDPTIMKSMGSGKMTMEGSISFNRKDLETTISINAPSTDEEKNRLISPISPKSHEMDGQLPSHKHEAAVKLQKVYKSFRTRRKLADCAVIVELEQSWWNLLDSAELKHSSISFFDMDKHETAISRWSRARTRAAKVGKGLLKNEKARKLALQHWLEAIDPRHRYGHNLHFYYLKWLHCQSREPFFYWLDIGEGKEVNLVEKCPRTKLQQLCIKYLGPMERKAYEVVISDGRLLYKQTGELLDTTEPKAAKWIFVLSTSKVLYVGQKKKGTFQHSSFLAGGAASAAGRLVVEKGTLKAVWPHSGHYQPTKENFNDFISFLEENNVNLADVEMSPNDEDDESLSKQKSTFYFRSTSSEEDLSTNKKGFNDEEWTSAGSMTDGYSGSLRNLASLETLAVDKLPEKQENKCLDHMTMTQDLSDEEHDENEEHGEDEKETNVEDSVVQRINSVNGTKPCELVRKLSRTWTSGTGPRISCVRDYPSELQFRALEQVNLSPRSSRLQCTEERTPTGIGGGREKTLTPLVFEEGQRCMWGLGAQQFSPLCRGTSVGANISQA